VEEAIMRTKVSIVKGSLNPQEKEIRGMVERAIELIGGIDDIISRGDRVLIKPNVAYELKPGETEVSDPRVAKAVYEILVERGAKPVIGESSAAGVDGEAALKASGYYDLRDQGYEVMNLKTQKTVVLNNPKAKVLKKARIFKLAKEVDAIISLPVIKTHDHEPATLGLKNMKGVMPDSEKKKFHSKYGLSQAIADLNLVVKPKLTIVDGIFCREGLGYPWSEEVEMDLILAGKDPVAVDTVTLLVMGFDPKQQRHAVLAEEHGIGTMDVNEIEVVGEEIESVKRRFKTAAEALQSILKLQDFRIISNDKMCTGCRGVMFYFLKVLDDQGKLDQIKDLTFVLGEQASLPEIDKEKTILVGVCTERYKGLGRYVPGCPPLSSTVITEIVQTKTKQIYASK
jgi:uncharacterized protein (DUF362 family)